MSSAPAPLVDVRTAAASARSRCTGERQLLLPACRFALLAVAPALGACVGAPTSQDWMQAGYRTPEQTLHTFQTAVRADEPDLELRCFSSGFRARNHVSRFTWREFLDELRRSQPFLRKGIVDAEIDGPVERSARRASIRLLSHGVAMRIDLVLEDSGELWAGGDLVLDQDLEFADPDHTGVQSGARGEQWIYARLALPNAVAAGDVTEIRLAREWKIDGIANLGEASETASAARPPQR
jgi:hypothetical protein